jgi:hypothetical protein
VGLWPWLPNSALIQAFVAIATPELRLGRGISRSGAGYSQEKNNIIFGVSYCSLYGRYAKILLSARSECLSRWG